VPNAVDTSAAKVTRTSNSLRFKLPQALPPASNASVVHGGVDYLGSSWPLTKRGLRLREAVTDVQQHRASQTPLDVVIAGHTGGPGWHD